MVTTKTLPNGQRLALLSTGYNTEQDAMFRALIREDPFQTQGTPCWLR